jgi:hypothetical protein
MQIPCLKSISILLLCFLMISNLQGQEPSLLDLLDEDEPEVEYVKAAFKSSRVINSHSMEMLHPGTMDFRILHRFGPVNRGFYDLFGLDQASMRIGFDYGISKHLTIGVGRSTFNKEMDGFVKYRLIAQQTGKRNIPLSVVLVTGMTMDGRRWANPDRVNYFSSRLAYYHQIIIGRKFNDWVSLQVTPGMVHRNLVASNEDPHDIFYTGIGGRLKLTKRIAFTADYHYVFNPADPGISQNPLSLGLDIETGGHVFQLHFSNAIGMNERAFITDTNAPWGGGEIRFGFNLSRMFQIKKQ